MNIAIYSRKSKFTGKGESIENQIQLCTEYATIHFDNAKILVYEDEGFSGGNTNRPEFQRLMKDAKSKNFDILICYRLDRVSRNIADFSVLIEKLQSYDIGFVSIKEQFDTTTSMGRAMMYISGVFAQLERETIAERVRDNMLQLAKTGRWLGGMPPMGFKSNEIVTIDPAGKSRKMYQLDLICDEITTVQLIYTKFLEMRSLTKVETFLMQNEIRTRKDRYYNISSIKLILSNPVYVAADTTVYDYFVDKGCDVCFDKGSFDGTKGIMPYNRTNQSKKSYGIKNDTTQWIISLGAHEPIISSEHWIEVQTIINKNKDKSFRKVRSQEALLSGILKCDCCGSYMRPKQSRMSSDGTKMHYYYMCELKEKSKGTKCNVKNVSGHTLDIAIIDRLKMLSFGESELNKLLVTDKIEILDSETVIIKEIEKLKSEVDSNECAIKSLLESLQHAKESIASKYIISQINGLGAEIANSEERLAASLEKKNELSLKCLNLDLMQETLKTFSSLVDKLTVMQRRDLIRTIVEDVTWDGENINVNVFGANALKKL